MQIFVVHFLDVFKDGTSSAYIQNAYANENKAYINAIIFNMFDENKNCRLTKENMDKNNIKLEDSEIKDLLVNLIDSKDSDISNFKTILEKLDIEDLKKINNWIFLFNISGSTLKDTSVAEVSECNLEDLII